MAAKINIKVDSNFDQAAADIKKFGSITESERKRITKFQESFKTERIDAFIDRNRRVGAAVTAAKGPIEGITAQTRKLQNEIQGLITRGLDPESAEVQKLSTEYDRLNKELAENSTRQEEAAKAAQLASKALLAVSAAAIAAGAAIIKSTTDLAMQGDQLAKTSRSIGINVEAFQELEFAAERQGVSSGSLGTALQKLNKNIGDVRSGTGALTTLLSKQNPELLTQLKNVRDNEEAFNVLTDAISKAPTQFDKAALSQAAFGRAGQEIILLADAGAKGIADLRNEAQSYGVVSEKVATLSEEFSDKQRNLQQATIGFRSELAGRTLPAIINMQQAIINLLREPDKLIDALENIGIVLAGATAGLLAFLAVSKGAALIQGLATAFRVLTAAIAANPIGAIAVVITTILVPAIILLIKNWDKVVVIVSTTIEKMKAQFSVFGENLTKVWVTATNSVKIKFLELAKIVIDNVLGAVQKFLDIAGKLPFVGEKFQELSSNVDGFKQTLNDAIAAEQASSEEAINLAEQRLAAAQMERDKKIEILNQEQEARLEALRIQEEQNKAAEAERQAAAQAHQDELTNIDVSSLAGRLAVLQNMEAQSNIERVTEFNKFLETRMKQEEIDGSKRIEFLQSELARIKDLETLSNEEKLAAEKSVQKEITRIQKEESDARTELKRAELQATANLFGALGDLVSAAGKQSRTAAIVSKGLARAQAGINSYLAFTKTLADGGPFPINIINAAAVLASGIAQQIKIGSTSIPSAQTGTPVGGYEIPNTGRSSRADSVGIMATPGETVNITPRGEGGRSQRIIVQIDRNVIFDVINDGIETGEVRITADNIQGGISA